MGELGPYLLTFTPILKEKVWGGQRLSRYGKHLEPGKSYGESWELADLGSTSTSGGGGGAARSVIANGPLEGKTIGEVVRAWGPALLGERAWERVSAEGSPPAFPLLIKLLDANEHLSVQVHPSPEYAAAHPDAHLKTESWLVLEAEATGTSGDPVIFKGIRAGTDSASFASAIEAGTVVDHLLSEPAVPGECHTLPSGTCHALGAGVLVLEVQTPSDTTFRVYDWASEYGRSGRELHVEQARACLSFDGAPEPRAARLASGQRQGELARTDWYAIDGVACPSGGQLGLGPGACAVVVGTRGSGWLSTGSGVAVGLDPGRVVLVPASLAGSTVLTAGTSGLDAAIVTVL
jgi:mannose-6-phosphate isomerase